MRLTYFHIEIVVFGSTLFDGALCSYSFCDENATCNKKDISFKLIIFALGDNETLCECY